MDRLSKEALAESEVILNRTNIALARSRKLIESWATSRTPNEEQEDEDDENFKPESETAGVGSTVGLGDEDGPFGSLRRKNATSNDKLLEQLLGKKAARTHKKSQEADRRLGQSQHAAPKSLPVTMKPKKREAEDEEEEEGGRASAFKAKKIKHVDQRLEEASKPPEEQGHVQGEDTGIEQTTEDKALGERTPQVSRLPAEAKPQGQPRERRKATSYLDELLVKKSGKKKKH